MTERVSLALVLLFSCFGESGAEDAFPPPGDQSANYQVEVLVDGLHNPCGLVSRPAANAQAPGEVLFIESGAGRVLGLMDAEVGKTREVLTGLAVEETPDETGLRMAAWRIGFITPNKLAVLEGATDDRPARVAVYVLPDDGKVLTADQTDHAVELRSERKLTGTFPGMAVGETVVYFSIGLAEGGTITRAALAANRVESPQELVYLDPAMDLRRPTGLCLSLTGRVQFLATAFAGELEATLDSRIAFVTPSSGEVALKLACGLFDIVDLAYSPSGQLYAVDLGWHDEQAGGVYRLDDARLDGRPACRVVKIAEVVRPTSLLFQSSSTLYVTSLGIGENAGSVVKISGEF